MLPFVSSSSARVVSFFSRDTEPPGNSFSTREYFAAMRIERYLFVAWLATSPGVNTCIRPSVHRVEFRGCLQLTNEPLDASIQRRRAHPADHLRIDDRRNAFHGKPEIVVHYNIIIKGHRA